jgi:hypothetical protein
MFESKSGVLLIGGLGFFALAFLSNALVPWLMYRDLPERSAEELVNANVLAQFELLADRYAGSFDRHFEPVPLRPNIHEPQEVKDRMWAERDEVLRRRCAEALRLGRDVYVGEACWHCHSQFVRPVSNEDRRFGPVAASWEYSNELQRPVMFGTRRVGPDLSREAGRRGNDWHAVHFFKPRLTSPESVMPDYPWFFEETGVAEVPGDDGRPKSVAGPVAPNKRGLAIITYMQWLGSWLDSYPHYHPERVLYHREEGTEK